MEATESIAGRRRTRQYRTTAEKRLVVEATRHPGVSVATVARAHGVNANQVFYWRKLYEAGRLESTTAMSIRDADARDARLLPVTISEGAERQAGVAVAAARVEPIVGGGSIEVTLGCGTVRIAGAVDSGTLRAVLGCLLA
ncbi:MAG: transposase [Edaphobacter sp.]